MGARGLGAWKVFPSDDDGDVLRRLQSQGVDLDKARDVDFYCWVKDRATGEEIMALFDSMGFDSRLHISDEDEEAKRPSVYATKHMVPDYGMLIRIQDELNEILAQFDTECDGWGTLVHPEEVSADQALEAAQRQECARLGSDYVPAGRADKAGVADNLIATGIYPINGLRHRPISDTSGWYIWAGDEKKGAEKYFHPLQIEQLEQQCPRIVKYLGLAPGWRFLIGPDHEGVWFDPALLTEH